MDLSGMEMDLERIPAMEMCLSKVVDDGSVESQRYYLARRTALEMLKDRGYAVADSEITLSIKEFREIYGQSPETDRLKISTSLKSDPSKTVLVLFLGTGAVKVSSIRSIGNQIMDKDNLSLLILIVQSQVTNQAQKAVELFPFNAEIFKIADLLVNVTKHALKPKHEVLTDDEKLELMKKYSLEEKQLPRMLLKDAIARYYGLKKGQVVRISYNSNIMGSFITYRCIW
ncbi:DNA-directed RNA polymerase V subunit 5A-like [Impatiens glandulifera]|uniref:DNA-directed RNA polymerase V subunit 5A-like n=1 Tax=Impatiens glandulifera TaxID=253017 RepID=UPI001FB175DD|nr:DNA-directed RNA polymerase V subunit 5A-like [Impatiens glandulifera]